jgi:hypothetical protein
VGDLFGHERCGEVVGGGEDEYRDEDECEQVIKGHR